MGIALKKPDDVAGSTAPAILVGLFVAFGGVLYGCVWLELPSTSIRLMTFTVHAAHDCWDGCRMISSPPAYMFSFTIWK
jgi:hypothetical protein